MDDKGWQRALKRHLAATAAQAPRYQRLQEALGRLLAQEGSDTTVLPGERALAIMTGYSRVTVRKALAGLAADGLVRARAGSGTYVGERIVRSLSRLTGFTEDLRARGLDPRVTFLERATGTATPEDAMALAIALRTPVLRFRRLRFGGDRPLALEYTVVPQAILGRPEAVEESLYEALEKIGRRPSRALQRIRAVAVDDESARLLGLPPGAACLEIERRAFLPDGRAVEFTRSIYRGDSYDFVAELAAAAP
ncbi:MAG: GntR family transcriptional regulator [Steroidobacteraceae bacterium]|nr:GntR family transcriptional regulator [Steroidobacteraceae bacterium]